MCRYVKYIIGLLLILSILTAQSMALEYGEDNNNVDIIDDNNTQDNNIVGDEYGDGNTGGNGDSGNGDSFGGRGVVTCEPPINVAKIEKQKQNLVDNSRVTYTISNPEFGIYYISFTGKENESGIVMRAESLNDISKCRRVVPAVPGKIYKNTNVWLGSSLIKDTIIKFKVENTWLKDNNVSVPNVNVFQWNKYKEIWDVLDTNVTGEDNTYTYLESKANGLSQFAITGIRSEDDLKILADYPKDRIYPTADIPTANRNNNIKIVTGIVIILIIGAITAFYIIKRKKEKEKIGR